MCGSDSLGLLKLGLLRGSRKLLLLLLLCYVCYVLLLLEKPCCIASGSACGRTQLAVLRSDVVFAA